MMQKKHLTSASSCIFFVLLIAALLPFVLAEYQVTMATEMIIFSLFAVSYNLLLGYGGLLSFGHAMFFGVGAYGAAVALARIPDLPFLLVFLIPLLLALLVALATGVLLIRHKGAYFALLTLAFNALAYALATKFHNITGGDDGLLVFRPNLDFGVFEISMASTNNFYFFTLIILGAVLIYTYYFTRTAMGETVVLLRENDERIQFIGYSTAFSRLLLFAFTGALAGLAGTFYSLHFRFVSVEAISIDMTTTVLLMTFIGGTRTFWGPILGACIYIYFKDYLSGITDRWPLIMGMVFILMVLYAPRGLSGLAFRIKDFIEEKRQLLASK